MVLAERKAGAALRNGHEGFLRVQKMYEETVQFIYEGHKLRFCDDHESQLIKEAMGRTIKRG
jgi:hypothetical protein